MNNLLYYPYINIPITDWTIRTLLYYENIGSIVPQEYFDEPKLHYDSEMLRLVNADLVTPINPIQVLDRPWQAMQPFIEFIKDSEDQLKARQHNFNHHKSSRINAGKFNLSNINAQKFDGEVLYSLVQLGLATHDRGNLYQVETTTANLLMRFLAEILSSKLQRRPITNKISGGYMSISAAYQMRKRNRILEELIPFPQTLDLDSLSEFKNRYRKLLLEFRTKVEIIVLDDMIIEGSALFDEKISEIKHRKEELTARMHESKFQKIVYGTISNVGSKLHLPTRFVRGFRNAVSSVLRFENSDEIYDASGIKYLALTEKYLRK